MEEIEHNGEGFQYRVKWRNTAKGGHYHEAIVEDWRQCKYTYKGCSLL